MRIDRPTGVAALVTLFLAVPVYEILDAVVPELPPVFAGEVASDAPPPVSAAPPAVAAASPSAPEEPVDTVPHAAVAGTLRTPDGTPVPNEIVELALPSGSQRHAATSDWRGRFSIPDVATGADYLVDVLSEGRYQDLSEALHVPPDGAQLDLVLVPLASAHLAGRMVDADGSPIPGRTLLLEASHVPGAALLVTGDDGGRFWIDDAPTGRLTFTTRTIPHLQVRGPLLTPGADADVLVVLDEGSRELAGRVVGDRGVPVPGATLKLSWSYKRGDALSSSARTAVTDANGAFRFTELGPGPHQLAVRAEGYADARETFGVYWNSGDVELRLRPN